MVKIMTETNMPSIRSFRNTHILLNESQIHVNFVSISSNY